MDTLLYFEGGASRKLGDGPDVLRIAARHPPVPRSQAHFTRHGAKGRLAVGFVASVIILAWSGANAATREWNNFTGVPNDLWSTPANWVGNIAPVGGDPTLAVTFSTTATGSYISSNDIANLQLNKLELNHPITMQGALVGKSLEFTGATPLLSQLGAGAFTIDAPVIAPAPRLVLRGTGTAGLVTLNGGISGPGELRFETGAWKLTNAESTFSGGIVVRDGAYVEFAPLSGTDSGIDLTVGQRTIVGSSTIPLLINNGTLKLTTAGSGGITLSAARRIQFNMNGGVLDLTNTNALDPALPGGNIVSGDLALTLNNMPAASAVVKFNGGQSGLSQNSATDGNWNANGNTLRIVAIGGAGALQVELDNGAYYSATVIHPGSLTVRGKLGGDPTSGPAGAVNTGIGKNFGRFGINEVNTLGFHAGLRFEDAVEVSIPGASRQITGNITIAGSADGHPGYVAFSGRATGTGNQLTSELTAPGAGGPGQNVLHVGSSPVNSDTLTIETGGTAVFDARLRIEQAVNHGVLVNSQTVIKPGGLLRFGQSMSNFNFDPTGLNGAQTNANVGDIIVRGSIVGQGTTTSESVVDILLPAPVAGGAPGVPETLTSALVANGARPFGGVRFVDDGEANATKNTNQDLVINGDGFGGLKITANARPSGLFSGGVPDPVANDVKLLGVLTSSRLARLSGKGGYLTPAPTGVVFAFPAGGMWNDRDIGLRVGDHNPGGTDVSLAALTTWSRNLAVDTGATLDFGASNPFVFESGILHGKGIVSSSGLLRIARTAAVSPGLSDTGALTFQGNLDLLGDLVLDVSPLGADLLTIGGSISIGGMLRLKGGFGTSDLTIASYSGVLTGGFSSISGLHPDFNIDYGSRAASAIKLVYSPQPTVVWTGSGSGMWDTTTANWQGAAVFANRNKVLFDDTVSGNPTVTIAGNGVEPNLVTFENNLRRYTLVSSENAALGGSAQLVKNGAATLILSGPATYSGGTMINQGELWIGSDDALPDVGPVTVGLDAMLDTRGSSDEVGDLTVYGKVVGPTGTLTVSSLVLGSGAAFAPRLILNGNLTKFGAEPTIIAKAVDLGGAARTFTVEPGSTSPTLEISGPISGGVLIKAGGGTLVLSGANSQSSTTVQAGILHTRSAAAIPPGSDVAVSSSATLNLDGFISNLGGLDASGTVLLGNASLGVTSLTGNGVVNVGTTSLTIGQSIDTGFAGAITGSGIVTKSGSGTLRMTGTTNFSGRVVVSGGTLSLAAPGAMGTAVVSVNAGGALDISAGTANQLELNGGTIGSSTGASLVGTVQVSMPSQLRAADPKDPTIGSDLILGGNLLGAGNLTVLGATSVAGADGSAGVRLRSAAPSNYSGTITVLQSTKFELQTSSAVPFSPAGTGKIVLTAGTLLGGRLGTYPQLNLRNDRDGNVTLGNDIAISGTGFVNLNPVGVAPSGSISQLGTLRIGDGQTLGINGSVTYGVSFNEITLTGGTATFAPNTIGMGYTGTAELFLGPITESPGVSSGLRMEGAGSLLLSARNSYTGPTILAAGTTYLGAEGALPATTALILTGGSLDLSYPGRQPFSLTVSSLSGSAGSIFNSDFVNSRIFTVNQSTDSVFDGVISGTLGMIKDGAGKLTLGGSNGYFEATMVNSGTLEITGSIGSTALTVGLNGILAGDGTINSPILVNGMLAPGVSGPGTLNVGGGDLTLGGNSQTLLEIAGTNVLSEVDRVVGVRTLTLDGTIRLTLASGFVPAFGDSFDLFDATVFGAQNFNPALDLLLPALNGGLSWNVSSFTTNGALSVVPEPSVLHLAFAAAATMLTSRPRERSKNSPLQRGL